MPSKEIQWFPGHMAKARRLMQENLKKVDVLLELRDARIPRSSMNPEIDRLSEGKPKLVLLNKASLADPDASKKWLEFFASRGTKAILTDAQTGEGFEKIGPAVRELLREKLEHKKERGIENYKIRAMIAGIPNVGKSTFINRIAGKNKAKAENRPGVTQTLQWVTTTQGFELLDTPGVLWHKFESRTVGENLALIGSIKLDILDTEELAVVLCRRLQSVAPDLLAERYKLDISAVTELQDYELFEAIGRKRGFLISGGEINYERTAAVLLEEFRNGKIGRVTLDILNGDK